MHVGIDIGTTAAKAIAITDIGEVLARTQVPYPLSTPQPGWAEQDPDDWVRSAEKALAELDATNVGFSGQMHGLVALDDHDLPVRPAILWNDQRTSAECAEIELRLGLDRLIDLTGNRALTGFTAPKLLWMRAHEPEIYARIRSVLLPKDYVRLKLTGQRAIDVADASGTLLFDVANRRWSNDIIEALEVPGEWLPEVYESPEIAGAGDQAAAALGVGVTGKGAVSVVLGTSGVVFGALDRYRTDSRARVHVFCHAIPGMWHAMGVMLSAAGSLQWLRDAIAPDESFSQLAQEAAAWPPGCEGLVFAPYLAGERTPHADAHARGAFIGLSLRHNRGALIRSVLEGVAYGLRDSLELLRGLGVRPRVGRVSGGGARSELWRQVVASVLELPLETTAAEEGSAYGAALLASCASGLYAGPIEAATRCIRTQSRTEPNPEWVAIYTTEYERFRRLYPALKPFEET